MGEDETSVVGVVKTIGIGKRSIGSGGRQVMAHHVVNLVSHQTGSGHLMAGLQPGQVRAVPGLEVAGGEVGLLDEEVVAGMAAHHWPGVRGRTGNMQHIGGVGEHRGRVDLSPRRHLRQRRRDSTGPPACPDTCTDSVSFYLLFFSLCH